ncbi:MAG: hypothetical protein O3A00_02425 [Planctomycetota bacterium]|nr:hypothetical protein [Planctomycetota bacterium]
MKTALPTNDDGINAQKVDMSAAAVWRRIQRVDELNEACEYLAKFRPKFPETVDDGQVSPRDSQSEGTAFPADADMWSA